MKIKLEQEKYPKHSTSSTDNSTDWTLRVQAQIVETLGAGVHVEVGGSNLAQTDGRQQLQEALTHVIPSNVGNTGDNHGPRNAEVLILDQLVRRRPRVEQKQPLMGR